MQDATNLRVTTQARVVAKLVYHCTRQFPAEERFGLATQMRRAAVSIGSNISEGCGRHGDCELIHFLQIAHASASELQFQAVLTADLGLLAETECAVLQQEVTDAKKMLALLIKALRKQNGAKHRGLTP
jgi:four helix bundle protein